MTDTGQLASEREAIIVSSGEFLWGPAPQTIANQRQLLVTPIDTEFAKRALTSAKRKDPTHD